MSATKPARATDLAGLLRNPLVIFGLVLLGGDGPLLVVYGLTSDPVRAWVSLIAIVLFTFGIATFFCYLVRYKPRHLYAPGEIPEIAIGKSIYSDYELMARLAFAETADKPDKELESVSSDALKAVVNNVSPIFCKYLSSVANKDMTLDEHLTALEEGGASSVKEFGIDTDAFTRGYFLGLWNLKGLLFESALEQDKFTFRVSPGVLDLIEQRLHPETANSS